MHTVVSATLEDTNKPLFQGLLDNRIAVTAMACSEHLGGNDNPVPGRTNSSHQAGYRQRRDAVPLRPGLPRGFIPPEEDRQVAGNGVNFSFFITIRLSAKRIQIERKLKRSNIDWLTHPSPDNKIATYYESVIITYRLWCHGLSSATWM